MIHPQIFPSHSVLKFCARLADVVQHPGGASPWSCVKTAGERFRTGTHGEQMFP
jgi:hypothetical protein